MGLDNGIYIYYNIDHLPNPNGHIGSNYLSIPYAMYQNLDLMNIERDKDNEICLCAEVVYWRKWWGCRNEVVNYLDYKYETNQDIYHWKLDREDCRAIINILYEFDNPNTWLEDGQSIWDYTDDNIHDQIQGDIQALKNIIALMDKKDPRLVKVEFYDSY